MKEKKEEEKKVLEQFKISWQSSEPKKWQVAQLQNI